MAELADYYRVDVVKSNWSNQWPAYFRNFYVHCQDRVNELNLKGTHGSDVLLETVINYELKPHGKLIKTKTQGWYLRWNDEKYHTAFVLRWS
jgi:hypothetical protein